jgi:hypothetical protein
LPIAIDTKAPKITIQSGIEAGKLNAKSTPVTTALRLPIVAGPWIKYLCISHSNDTQHATEMTVTANTDQPKIHTETARAGISAIRTSPIMRLVERLVKRCGEGETIKFCFIFWFFCCFFVLVFVAFLVFFALLGAAGCEKCYK